MTILSKRLGVFALPLLLILPLASAQQNQVAAGVPAPFTNPLTVPTDLARLDASLNNTQSFSGRFTQYGADGRVDTGVILIKRPGKMRFEYDQPNPLLIVSDGVTLVQQDRVLETEDRVPLSATPLNFFLKEDVNLARDTEIISLIKTPSETRVTARDGSGDMDGEITMIFDASTLAFKAWNIADSFGGVTRVVLSDLEYNQRVDPRKFVLRSEDRRDRRGR